MKAKLTISSTGDIQEIRDRIIATVEAANWAREQVELSKDIQYKALDFEFTKWVGVYKFPIGLIIQVLDEQLAYQLRRLPDDELVAEYFHPGTIEGDVTFLRWLKEIALSRI